MSTLAQRLRRYPVLFDRLNLFARKWFRRSEIYSVLNDCLCRHPVFTFIQIGGNDGITKDPYREFMIRHGARGLTTEPVPDYFQNLRANYLAYPHVTAVNCAVGYPRGRLPFHFYNEEFIASKGAWGKELSGLASFTRDKLLTGLRPDEIPEQSIQTIDIEVETVEDLMARYNFPSFDCLFIDCEGHEHNILLNLDFTTVKPRLISFEHTHCGDLVDTIESRLVGFGFTLLRLQHDTIAYLDDEV